MIDARLGSDTRTRRAAATGPPSATEESVGPR